MAITYKYKIYSIRVVTQENLANVVKEVDIIVTGDDGPVTFDLPATIKFESADPDNFTEFDDLTEAQIVEWLETEPSLEPIRLHVKLVLDREVAKRSMENKPLPWAPTIEQPAANTSGSLT